MRQLRVKFEQCYINSSCRYDYSLSNEEKRSFQPGWINQTTHIYNLTIQQAFKYQNNDELDSYIYVGES